LPPEHGSRKRPKQTRHGGLAEGRGKHVDESDLRERLARIETMLEWTCTALKTLKEEREAVYAQCRVTQQRIEDRQRSLEAEMAKTKESMLLMEKLGLVFATGLSGVVAWWSLLSGGGK
jgi:hypothetical protein